MEFRCQEPPFGACGTVCLGHMDRRARGSGLCSPGLRLGMHVLSTVGHLPGQDPRRACRLAYVTPCA